MGSKKDRVTVPYGKHGIDASRQRRTAERTGKLPEPEIPAHRRRKGKNVKKGWKLQAQYTFRLFNEDLWTDCGRYEKEKDADQAANAQIKKSYIAAVRIVNPAGDVTAVLS